MRPELDVDRHRASTGRGDQHEQDARAAAWHPPDLTGLSGEERGIVAMLGGLAEPTAPDRTERARMRSRVLAGLAEDVTEKAPSSVTTKPRLVRPPGGRSGRASRPPRGPRSEDDRPRSTSTRARLAIAAFAVLCLVFALGGMSLLLSRDALPGDALYGIKRTAEAASLGLTFGDEPKALKHLEFASSRVSEMETLAQRYGPGDAPVGGYLSALTDFDTDASAGSRQLIALTTRQDGSLLSTLSSWGRQQASRLTAIAGRLPAQALPKQSSSLALATAIADRADALSARLPCEQITSGNADAIGALPASGSCVSASSPATGGPSTAPNVNPSPTPSITATSRPNPPTPSSQPTPTGNAPLLPGVPIVTPPTSGVRPSTGAGTTGTPPPLVIPLPLPLPPISVGPLPPGLPGLQVGG